MIISLKTFVLGAAAAALTMTVPAAAQSTARPAAAKAKAASPKAAVTRTLRHSYVIGNPKAPNTLVEYMSYTCNHCARFAIEAEPGLRAALASGKLKFEVRNLLRDPLDLTAAMLARCGTLGQFPANHATLMASQERWLAKAEAAGPAAQQAWFVGEFPQRFDHIARDTGLYGEMQKLGFSQARLKACLAEPTAPEILAQQTQRAIDAEGVDSTPSFFLNGKRLDTVHNWTTLKPHIDAL